MPERLEMNAQPRFGTVITAMITPFDAEGALDLDCAAELADRLAGYGSDGLVLAGTTGESPVLTEQEENELVRTVRRAVPATKILMGTGSNDTSVAVRRTEEMRDMGVDGALVVAPYYNKPSQEGLGLHFDAVARAAGDLDVVIYDIPGRTGRKIATETILDIAQRNPNVVGLKDAAGNVAETARLIALAPEGFEVYSGDDALNLPLAAVGAVGAISVASHWAGEEMAEMFEAVRNNDLVRARALNVRMMSSYAFETSDRYPNPMPAKVMMRLLGIEVGNCRLPHAPPTDELWDMAAQVMRDLKKPL